MKKLNLLAVASLVILTQLAANPAEARTKKKAQPPVETVSQPVTVAPEHEAGSAGLEARFGAGLATAANITGSPTALTAIAEFAGGNALQAYAGIANTSPSFSFGVGALFKHTLFGNENTGLHVGGGIGLGSSASTTVTAAGVATGNAFSVSIDGDIGVHTLFPGTHNILLSVDGGPSLFIIDGNANFMMGGFSPGIGFSVNYLF